MQRWKTRNGMSVAELLIEFFEFYALGFRVADFVVSIRNVGGFSKNDKQWKGKKLAIEDPFSPKRNLTRSVSGLSTLDYINDCFKIAYLYFGTIQTTEGPVITRILVPDASPERRQSPVAAQEDSEHDKIPEGVGQLLEQLRIQPSGAEAAAGGASAIKDRLPADKVITLEELEKSFNYSNEAEVEDSDDETSEDEEADDFKSMETLESFMKKYGRELTPKQAKRVTELVPKNKICFQFVSDILTAGHSPTLVCSVCNAEGHLQHACPEEEMPPARPLRPLPRLAIEILNRICGEVQNRHQPSANELRERDQFMRDLSRFIKKSTPKAVLTVFGSSHNGFAFAHSDLDISMTLEDHETDEGIDAIELIERLAEKLKRMNGIRNVQAITSAKVPIIKFISIQYQPRIEGDISLYNILAQENTKMLRCYSNIDFRVKVSQSELLGKFFFTTKH